MANIYFQVLKHHADAQQRMYGVKWVPQDYHWKACKKLFESEEGFEPYTVEDIVARLEVYYREEWWKTVRHDFSNFCKHIDKFVDVKPTEVVRRSTYHCPECGQNHRVQDPCPPLRDVASLILPLTQKKAE